MAALLAAPIPAHAYYECTQTITVYGDGTSDCSTHCEYFDNATGKRTGTLDYGWC